MSTASLRANVDRKRGVIRVANTTRDSKVVPARVERLLAKLIDEGEAVFGESKRHTGRASSGHSHPLKVDEGAPR